MKFSFELSCIEFLANIWKDKSVPFIGKIIISFVVIEKWDELKHDVQRSKLEVVK